MSPKIIVKILAAAIIMNLANWSLHTTAIGAPHGLAGGERKAVLEALRQPVQRDLKQPIEFVISKMRAEDQWVFVIAELQKPGGTALNWSETICAGDQSHLVGALLQQSTPGKWIVVAYALCPTDVAWEEWPQQYNAPPELFR
jgi:hypothetical protein